MPPTGTTADKASTRIASAIASTFQSVRDATTALAEPLSPEDAQIQAMEDASPAKWHLAHTTWFFETFVLAEALPDEPPFDPAFRMLFNSYYQGVGPAHQRNRRGLLSRPRLDEVRRYRTHVDEAVERLLAAGVHADFQNRIMLGIHHEQQHQELLLTDILYTFWCNPLRPAYRDLPAARADAKAPPIQWRSFGGGVQSIGWEGSGFAYDNEAPRHRVFLEPFEIASRLVTNAEFAAFIEDGGYRRPDLWLSDGWATVQAESWSAPLYWENRDGAWWTMTLGGMCPVEDGAPVCHVSYYEADAFARWAGARLPTEEEWETAAAACSMSKGHFVESETFRPMPISESTHSLSQMFGDVWEWTASPYTPYPGYRPPTGALGEYNAKFMCNQMVLRGGSCATPASHIRPTYRNFFGPAKRWQFSGLRLAREAR